MSELVILVDKNDNEIGVEEKIKAHKEAKLHRAFSIFVFNEKGEMLIHKRAACKYHSPNLWTNACCSHPRPNEPLEKTARKRLKEEMGIECDIEEIFTFIYKAHFDNGLTEYELDHVFIGICNDIPNPNPNEVAEWKWISVEELINDVKKHPEIYTVWFKIVLEKVIDIAKNKRII